MLIVLLPSSAESQTSSGSQGNTRETREIQVDSNKLAQLIRGKKVTLILADQSRIEGKVVNGDEKQLTMRISRSTVKGHVAGHEAQVPTDDVTLAEYKKGRSSLSYGLLIAAGTAISAYLGQSVESHARYIPLYSSLGGSVALHATRPTIRVHITPTRP